MSQPTKGRPLETTGDSAMEVRVTDITSSPSGLHLGCVVEGPEGAWIRFAQVSVPWSTLPLGVRQDAMVAFDEQHSTAEPGPALF